MAASYCLTGKSAAFFNLYADLLKKQKILQFTINKKAESQPSLPVFLCLQIDVHQRQIGFNPFLQHLFVKIKMAVMQRDTCARA